MAQRSGPFTDEPFTDRDYRTLHAGPGAIIEDRTGSSFGIRLSTNSDEVFIGSDSQPSFAEVGGHLHEIPAGQPQAVVIPPPSGAEATTAIIGSLFVEQWATRSVENTEGPVRLIAQGSDIPITPELEGEQAPGTVQWREHWAVVRQPGKALADPSTTVIDLRQWRGGEALFLRNKGHLPNNGPIGQVAYVLRSPGSAGLAVDRYVFVKPSNGAPDWFCETPTRRRWTSSRGKRVEAGFAEDRYAPTAASIGLFTLEVGADAPAGEYVAHMTWHGRTEGPGSTRHDLFVHGPSGIAMIPAHIDVRLSASFTASIPFHHVGGNARFEVRAQTRDQVVVINNNHSRLDVVYQGPSLAPPINFQE